MKDDWISFPIPGGGEDWTRVGSIIGVDSITTLTLAASKLSRELERIKFVSEHPQADLPEVEKSPYFLQLKKAKAWVTYISLWGSNEDTFVIYTTLDPAQAMAKIRAAEAEL